MVGFPPVEAREDSLRALGRVDLFGTGVNPQQMERMRQLEVRMLNALRAERRLLSWLEKLSMESAQMAVHCLVPQVHVFGLVPSGWSARDRKYACLCGISERLQLRRRCWCPCRRGLCYISLASDPGYVGGKPSRSTSFGVFYVVRTAVFAFVVVVAVGWFVCLSCCSSSEQTLSCSRGVIYAAMRAVRPSVRVSAAGRIMSAHALYTDTDRPVR